jgi:hypothetical protein
MNIFLAHAAEDRKAAESIALSLRGRGYKVFLDQDDLPPGRSFDQRIERAVEGSDVFIFLISPDSVADGRYTHTELLFARRKWKNPDGRVLPVMARKTPLEQIPPYLKAVGILEPRGDIAAETSATVKDMRPQYFSLSTKSRPLLATSVAVPTLAFGIAVWIFYPPFQNEQPKCEPGRSLWQLGQSYVCLEADRSGRRFSFKIPSPDFKAQGAKTNDVLFDGACTRVADGSCAFYEGKLYAFAGSRCRPLEYGAAGPATAGPTVTLDGMEPQIDQATCRVKPGGEQKRTFVFNWKHTF